MGIFEHLAGSTAVLSHGLGGGDESDGGALGASSDGITPENNPECARLWQEAGELMRDFCLKNGLGELKCVMRRGEMVKLCVYDFESPFGQWVKDRNKYKEGALGGPAELNGPGGGDLECGVDIPWGTPPCDSNGSILV